MTDLISVIIPTYNPRQKALNQTLQALKDQTLATSLWELIVVDNNSQPPVSVDLGWHPAARLVVAQQQGLTYARLKGFEQATGEIVVMLDDDNVPDKNYLENILAIFTSHPQLGAVGGKSLPLFEAPPPAWLNEFYASLALRDLGETTLLAAWQNQYPACAPIGAGMGIRMKALQPYIERQETRVDIITDRLGGSLASGGDNDIVIGILKAGWQVGYFPALRLQHIIPAQRMTVKYMARLLKETNRSWIRVLQKHHICPWEKIPAWSVPFRKLKAWFTYKAPKNEVNYIRWRGACGMYEALSG